MLIEKQNDVVDHRFVESAKKTVGVSAVKKNTNAKAQAVQRESIFVLPFHLYF